MHGTTCLACILCQINLCSFLIVLHTWYQHCLKLILLTLPRFMIIASLHEWIHAQLKWYSALQQHCFQIVGRCSTQTIVSLQSKHKRTILGQYSLLLLLLLQPSQCLNARNDTHQLKQPLIVRRRRRKRTRGRRKKKERKKQRR